jgi:hypothetical protein
MGEEQREIEGSREGGWKSLGVRKAMKYDANTKNKNLRDGDWA